MEGDDDRPDDWVSFGLISARANPYSASVPLLPICPECAWDTARPPRQAFPASLGWRRLAVLVWVFLIAATITALLAREARTSSFGFGVPYPEVVLPPVTLADVQRIADGRAKDATFVDTILRTPPAFRTDITDTWSLEVGFISPDLNRTESQSFGWPTSWWNRTRHPEYDDAVRARGLQASKTVPTARPIGLYEIPSNMREIPKLPRWEWQGRELLYRPPPEETGGIFTETRYRFPALAAPVAILLLLWLTLGLLIWRAERKDRDTARLRRFRLLAIGATTATIIVLAFVASPAPKTTIYAQPALKQVGSPPGPVYWSREGFNRLSLTKDHAAALPPTPQSARQLAQAILSATGTPAGTPDALYLAVGSDPSIVVDETKTRSTSITHTFPVFSFAREFYTRRPDFGTVEPVAHPCRSHLVLRPGFWTILWPSPDPARPTLALTILPEMLGLLIVGIGILALAMWFPLVGLAEWRTRRRHTRGLCPRCGYQVETAPRPAT